MAYKIAIARKGSDVVQTVCPGSWPTDEAVRAEILDRNAKFPLAPRIERVVLIMEVN